MIGECNFDSCFVLSSIDQTMWLTTLSTAVLVLVIGSVVAMLVAAENRRADEFEQNRQNSYRQQAPSRGTVPVEDSR